MKINYYCTSTNLMELKNNLNVQNDFAIVNGMKPEVRRPKLAYF